jgi:Possible hemagglutinin (DUF637)
MSPAFKALLAAAVAWSGVGAAMGNSLLSSLGVQGAYATTALGGVQATTWLGQAATAFMGSLTTGVLEGGLTGNFNLGQILEGATFSAVSVGLVSGVNLDTIGVTLGEGAFNPLWSVGSGNLTLSAIMEKGLDSALTAGLSSAVYGTDFGAGFAQSWGQAILTLARNDLQNDIGASFASGSTGSWSSHLLLGCAFASSTGADCSAGMVGAATEQLFVASLGGPRPAFGTPEYEAWKANNANNLALIAATVGFVFSGGKAENVSVSADYAGSAFENNYLTTAQWDDLIASYETCDGNTSCINDLLESYKSLSEDQDAKFRECVISGNTQCVNEILFELRKLDAEYREIVSNATDAGLDLVGNDQLVALTGLDLDGIHTGEIISANPGNLDGAELGNFNDWANENCSSGQDCLLEFAKERQRLQDESLNTLLLAASLIPVIGDAAGIVECVAAPSALTCGAALVNIVPGIGDATSILLRNGDEVLEISVSGGKVTGAGKVSTSKIEEIAGKTCVYSCVIDGTTRYVGITDDVARRGKEHLRGINEIDIEQISGLDNLSRADAKAVEQTLINYYGLGKEGGTLLNKINSISATRNPTTYEQALIRGKELLDSVGYKWTN